ncbi:MAG: hypothetical protein EOP88_04665 [Verrucomicrobiaceae bacterium]|nr:MAG: hypothetical protein EOP88_04665 [Verrucomicrobiaceae bacterium]
MRSHLSVTRALAKGKLILSVDATRPPGDTFKLPTALASTLKEDISNLKQASAASAASRPAATGQDPLRAAFDKLEAALRRGHAGISAIIGRSLLPSGISDTDRLAIFTAYGWGSGRVCNLSDSRLLLLGELALQGEANVANRDWRYPAKLVQLIREQLQTIAREEAAPPAPDLHHLVERLEQSLQEVKQFYLALSHDRDHLRELSRISLSRAS